MQNRKEIVHTFNKKYPNFIPHKTIIYENKDPPPWISIKVKRKE